MESLSHTQLAALLHVEARATTKKSRADLEQLVQAAGAPTSLLDEVLARTQTYARVAVHFHPDRLGVRGKSVAEALLDDGVYRNQFETGISNGDLSAFKGGNRDLWEADLFGGCYQQPDIQPEERPKYGALDILRFGDGPSPRFGSCYLILKPTVSQRCTFTFGDSHQPTGHAGVMGCMDDVLLGLLKAVAAGEWPFDTAEEAVPTFLMRLRQTLTAELPDPQRRPLGRSLDRYIEAQIHGPLRLSADVEVLVADPAFKGTPTGLQLERACTRSGVTLRWHPGFLLPVQSVSDVLRGPAMPLLARRIAGGEGVITAATIGQAAISLCNHPDRWADWGTPSETAQHLKQLWHVLVASGKPDSRIEVY